MDGFKNIEIKNFRGIDYLKIEDFSRVNVFVGQNNSGKSSVLGETKTQKELIKDHNRNYENKEHWDLDAEYMESLHIF